MLTSERIQIYNAKDVAEMLKCSKSQAYKIMHLNNFPSFTIGKRLFVTDTDFNKFIEHCKRKNVFRTM